MSKRQSSLSRSLPMATDQASQRTEETANQLKYLRAETPLSMLVEMSDENHPSTQTKPRKPQQTEGEEGLENASNDSIYLRSSKYLPTSKDGLRQNLTGLFCDEPLVTITSTNEADCALEIQDEDNEKPGLAHLSKTIHTSYINLKRTNPLNYDKDSQFDEWGHIKT